MKKSFLLLILLLPAFLSAQGQTFKRSGFGLTPERDSLACQRIRAQMDSIRATRPTVALVLSGGGAKGAAHISAIRYIESLGIPIDMVLGTSMGGLVGGMYALGYSPDHMESLIRSIDWDVMLSDRIPRESLSFTRYKQQQTYMVSFPFYYAREVFSERFLADPDGTPLQRAGDNLRGSLPSGVVTGIHIGDLLSAITVGYQDSLAFDNLPIPFLCIATDLVSERAKVFHEGKITEAMRATMSIPGLFAPVRTNGMMLVDGGMRNNFPSDIARELGADLIIGVVLSGEKDDYNRIRNFLNIASQSVNMLVDDAYDENQAIPDVVIHPDLREFNALSFDTGSIDTIIRRGEEAARARQEELLHIKALTGESRPVRKARAIDIGEKEVRVGRIAIEGVDPETERVLLEKLPVREGGTVDRAQAEKAVASLFGTGYFESVQYELPGDQEPFPLIFRCRRGPIHQFSMSTRMDSEEIIAAIFDIGLNVNSFRGHMGNVTAKVGNNPYVKGTYKYSTPGHASINATAGLKLISRSNFNNFGMDHSLSNIEYFTTRQEVFLSDLHLLKGDVRIGLRNDYFRVNEYLSNMGYSLDKQANDYLSVFAHVGEDTLDDDYFPTRGFSVTGDYQYLLTGLIEDAEPVHIVSLSLLAPLGKGRFQVIPSADLRFVIGADPQYPFMNAMGGYLRGRYVEQQIPFVGINNAEAMNDYLVTGQVAFRYTPAKKQYATLKMGYARDFDDLNQASFRAGRNLFGIGVEYAYDALTGPLKADLHWSTLTHKVGLYISLGFDF